MFATLSHYQHLIVGEDVHLLAQFKRLSQYVPSQAVSCKIVGYPFLTVLPQVLLHFGVCVLMPLRVVIQFLQHLLYLLDILFEVEGHTL